ncbi:MAG: bifunctional oligoribonuclease/PAP phosphatase NrnA [Clostridia bacterium]|nr:bifunctional oligoribonuclease/PAP phosphatase NrnA [Clostridia bacterium]
MKMIDKFDVKYWNECITQIDNASSVSLFPHIHADGDALGSVFALAVALRKKDKAVKVFLCDSPEEALGFLVPGSQWGIDVIVLDATDSDDLSLYTENPSDLAIGIDCAGPDRMDNCYAVYKMSPNKIKIDHHVENPGCAFGDSNFVYDGWAATGEAVWLLLNAMGIEIDYEIAIRLYTALLTDTGRFVYSNVTPLTFYIASQLISVTGSDITWISRQVYDVKPKRMIKLLSAVYSKIEYFENGRIAYVYVPDKMFKDAGALLEDTNALSSIMRDIEDVEVSIFVRDGKHGALAEDDKTLPALKASMRSCDKCNVAAVASAFGGGGHVRAAGLSFAGEEPVLKEKLLAEVRKQLNG